MVSVGDIDKMLNVLKPTDRINRVKYIRPCWGGRGELKVAMRKAKTETKSVDNMILGMFNSRDVAQEQRDIK